MADSVTVEFALRRLLDAATKIATGEKEIVFIRERNSFTGVGELKSIQVQNTQQ